jgi:hypothetical protein
LKSRARQRGFLLWLKEYREEREPMAVEYAWERFYSEIRFALVSDAPLQERLGCLIAGVSHLQRESFPDDHVWDDFRRLVNETTRRETRQQGEGRVPVTPSQMSDEKAKECLQAAFDIFSHVAKAFGRTEFVI